MAQTVLRSKHSPSGAAPLRVEYTDAHGRRIVRHFHHPVRIGRGADCDCVLDFDDVSRVHAELAARDTHWIVRDLHSTNGTYVNGRRIDSEIPVSSSVTINLAHDGPCLFVSLTNGFESNAEAVVPGLPGQGHLPNRALGPGTEPSSVGHPPSIARGDTNGGSKTDRTTNPSADEDLPSSEFGHELKKLLTDSINPNEGARTRFLRRAIQGKLQRQRRRYRRMLLVVSSLLLIAGVVSAVLYHSLRDVNALASEIFYDMKTLELQIAQLERNLPPEGAQAALASLVEHNERLEKMAKRYRRFLESSSTFSQYDTPQERLILRMARLFGECDLHVPDEFVREVKRYIEKWRQSKRFEYGIRALHKGAHLPTIVRAMQSQRLQPHFLYVALQESGFNTKAVGPKTRYGHAKGAWQFIPQTAQRYGLEVGTKSDTGDYDPQDQRFDFPKATQAAARYLRDIYSTEAQASGLLVMASYNWGEHRIIRILRRLPEDPRKRNFWALLESARIPDETYDYVLNIFSAAVIGEDPKLFGFDIENPLAPYLSGAEPTVNRT